MEPSRNIEMQELFAPQQPGKGLSLDKLRVLGEMCRSQVFIEFIGLSNPLFKESIDMFQAEGIRIRLVRQTEMNAI